MLSTKGKQVVLWILLETKIAKNYKHLLCQLSHSFHLNFYTIVLEGNTIPRYYTHVMKMPTNQQNWIASLLFLFPDRKCKFISSLPLPILLIKVPQLSLELIARFLIQTTLKINSKLFHFSTAVRLSYWIEWKYIKLSIHNSDANFDKKKSPLPHYMPTW